MVHIHAGVFDTIEHDLWITVRLLADRDQQPSVVIYDARTMQSTPESSGRAGYDVAKKPE